jgi:hypothetical protein
LIRRPFRTLFARTFHPQHVEHDRTRRNLLILSLANWGVAIVAWTISAFLGITSPASIIVYTVLFVIGLFAVGVALASFVLEKFAHRPEPISPQPVADDAQGAVAAPDA